MNATAAPDVTGLLARAGKFARDELRPVALRYDETEEYPLAELRRAAELGLTCFDLPIAFGGGGIERLTDRCAVIEELSFGDSPIFWVIAQGGFFAGRCWRSDRTSRSSAICRRSAAPTHLPVPLRSPNRSTAPTRPPSRHVPGGSTEAM